MRLCALLLLLVSVVGCAAPRSAMLRLSGPVDDLRSARIEIEITAGAVR